MDGKAIPTVGQLPSGPFPVKSSVGILKPELVREKDTSFPMTRISTWSGVTSARSVIMKGFGFESVGIGAELVKVWRSNTVRRLPLMFGPAGEGKSVRVTSARFPIAVRF